MCVGGRGGGINHDTPMIMICVLISKTHVAPPPPLHPLSLSQFLLAPCVCIYQVGGRDGAGHIAQLLESRKEKFLFVLDEGMVVTDGVIQGVDTRVAL